MTQKHFNGCTKSNLFVDRELPSCIKYEEHLAAWKAPGKINGKNQKARVKTLANKLGLEPKSSSGGGPVVLDIKTNRCDIFIMHGQLLQSMYEHQVVPKGKLRFALTCENIELDNLKSENRPDNNVNDEELQFGILALPLP